MRKHVIRAAVLTVFTAGLTGTAAVTGAGTAMACVQQPGQSWELAASLPQVNYGDHGQYVLGLQLALRDEGYQLNGTGNYADNTLAAVRDFQRRHGINDSGIVGSKTWNALVGPKSELVTHNGKLPPPDLVITPGEQDADKIAALQNALIRIHPYDSWGWPGEGDVYGPETQRMVRDFQLRTGINNSGIVGPKTWSAMYLVISVSGHWGC